MSWLLYLLVLPFLVLRNILAMDYPRSDRWKRPLILLPDAKKEEAFTRVTTVAKTLSGQEALSEWKARMVAEGACLRPDILSKYKATLPSNPDDKKRKAIQNGLCDSLKEAAAASTGANEGEAFHQVSARWDSGEKFRPLPPHDTWIKSYAACLDRHDIEIAPEYIERTVVLPELGIAGSFDRLVGSRKKRNGLWVFDVKTGKDLSYSWAEIAIQLALYAHAEWLYDWDTRECSPMPEVDRQTGLVLWLPVATGEASLHVVDIAAGWEAAQLAMAVRSWRNRKDLAREAR